MDLASQELIRCRLKFVPDPLTIIELIGEDDRKQDSQTTGNLAQGQYFTIEHKTEESAKYLLKRQNVAGDNGTDALKAVVDQKDIGDPEAPCYQQDKYKLHIPPCR